MALVVQEHQQGMAVGSGGLQPGVGGVGLELVQPGLEFGKALGAVGEGMTCRTFLGEKQMGIKGGLAHINAQEGQMGVGEVVMVHFHGMDIGGGLRGGGHEGGKRLGGGEAGSWTLSAGCQLGRMGA